MPDQIDEDGKAKREGFIDNYPEMSLWVSGHVKPSDALVARSKAKNVKTICQTGKTQPTPKQMYQAGFRIVEILGSSILDAIVASTGNLAIVKDDGQNEINNRGHLNLKGGQDLCDVWARKCRILTEEETVGL